MLFGQYSHAAWTWPETLRLVPEDQKSLYLPTELKRLIMALGKFHGGSGLTLTSWLEFCLMLELGFYNLTRSDKITLVMFKF